MVIPIGTDPGAIALKAIALATQASITVDIGRFQNGVLQFVDIETAIYDINYDSGTRTGTLKKAHVDVDFGARIATLADRHDLGKPEVLVDSSKLLFRELSGGVTKLTAATWTVWTSTAALYPVAADDSEYEIFRHSFPYQDLMYVLPYSAAGTATLSFVRLSTSELGDYVDVEPIVSNVSEAHFLDDSIMSVRQGSPPQFAFQDGLYVTAPLPPLPRKKGN
jgi:hypothetical protein